MNWPVLECMWQYMAFFLLRNSCCFSWGDQSSCLQTLFFFWSPYPDFWSPFQGRTIHSSMGDGGRGTIALQKHFFLVMCILKDAHFVAVPSQVEPWKREGIHLFFRRDYSPLRTGSLLYFKWFVGTTHSLPTALISKGEEDRAFNESGGTNGDQTSC